MQDTNFQMQFISAMAFLTEMGVNAENLTEKLGVSGDNIKILQEYGEKIEQSIADMPEDTFKQHLKFYLGSLAADILVAKTLQKYD